jgi:DNA-binding response OmpR family regulator
MTPTFVLLVEDDVLTRDMLNTELVDAGFELVVCPNGIQALAELDAGAARFKAIITDIRLGNGPDGWEVGRRARELVSHMPVIYVSGDSGHEWSSKGVPDSVMIAKPFAVAQVITAISMLITEADTRGAG